jgi:ABC-type transporter MlaC component
VLHALIGAAGDGAGLDLAAMVREAPVLHDRLDALDALDALRRSPVDMAFVVDEHGTFEGIVTAADLLEAIAGRFAAREAEAEPDAVRREDGSWLLAGWKPVDEMAELLKVGLPARRDYHTVAGFVLGRLGRFPGLGDAAEHGGWRFEVVDIDGRRIDKVLAQSLRAAGGGLARRAALVAFLIPATPRPVLAAAAADGPEAFVAGLGDRALALLRGTREAVPRGELAALLDDAVDLRLLARLVLGRHWNAADEDQRREYLELFRAYALQGLTSAFVTYAGLRRFVVTGTRPAGDGDALVGSELHLEPGRPPYRVGWRVRDAGGRFVVVDVVAEGVSLLVTNRDEFNSIVGRGGIEGLLREMRGWREEGAGAAPGAAPGGT